MKRSIFDLLDSIRDDTVQLKESTPLSCVRIKELTMEKIAPKEKKKSRVLYRILVAAAILSLLSVTAFAAEKLLEAGDWFRSVLNNQLEQDKTTIQSMGLDVTVPETITPEQIQVVNDLGKVFEQTSVTSEGTTVTLTAAYADANVMHLYFQVEAPEGTVLPDGIVYAFHSNETREADAPPILELPEVTGYTFDVQPLPDENPGDNLKDFHVTIWLQSGSQVKFNDGTSKKYHIDGIFQQIPLGGEDEFKLLAPGKFTFDIGLANDFEKISLNVEGITYGGRKTRSWTHDSPCDDQCQEVLTAETDPETKLPIHSESWEYSVTAQHLEISPLSVDWECTFTCSDERKYPGLQFQIITKDGTKPILEGGDGEIGADYCSGTSYFTVPIDLNNVDYLLIGDPEVGEPVKVYLP